MGHSSYIGDLVSSGRIRNRAMVIQQKTNGAKITKAAQSAWKAGRVGKSLATVVTRGPKAAQTFATTGRLVGKVNPIVVGLTLAWTAGSTGWFAYHARSFNRAAYELQKPKLSAA